jgi:hypothetical protein
MPSIEPGVKPTASHFMEVTDDEENPSSPIDARNSAMCPDPQKETANQPAGSIASTPIWPFKRRPAIREPAADHSARSDFIGSIEAARRAGT